MLVHSLYDIKKFTEHGRIFAQQTNLFLAPKPIGADSLRPENKTLFHKLYPENIRPDDFIIADTCF